MPDRYALFGHPVAHSRSVQMHAAFARQTGQDMSYELINVPPGNFVHAVREFLEHGGRGGNVTLPYKEEAFRLADKLTPRARLAGAVNTLRVEGDRKLLGDNTDGDGLLRDLQVNRNVSVPGARVLLLGAGGAARGALGPLLAAGPAAIALVNRTVSRARTLAERFRKHGAVEACAYAELAGRRFDLVINATSLSLQDAVPPLPDDLLAPQAFAYDMVVAPTGETAFTRWALEHGAQRACDGWGMMLEQGADSFALWRGVRPETQPLLKQHRSD